MLPGRTPPSPTCACASLGSRSQWPRPVSPRSTTARPPATPPPDRPQEESAGVSAPSCPSSAPPAPGRPTTSRPTPTRSLPSPSPAAAYLCAHPTRPGPHAAAVAGVIPQRISLDDQGEAVAVAVAVAVVTGTLFSGAGTLFSGAGTGFSTVTVRTGGRGGAASSRLPALMRPRSNPTSSPKISPTANVANHTRTALCSPTVILLGLALLLLLLLPIVLSLHPFLDHTCPAT